MKILNKNKDSFSPATSILIMRPAKWGNPFIAGGLISKKDAVIKYGDWLVYGKHIDKGNASEEKRKTILNNLHQLKDKDLLCCCSPSTCHGEVLRLLLEYNNTTRLTNIWEEFKKELEKRNV